jgi:hypothetical protein
MGQTGILHEGDSQHILSVISLLDIYRSENISKKTVVHKNETGVM